MLKTAARSALFVALCLGPIAPALGQDTDPPDRVELSNGDVMTGTVKSITADEVTFDSAALGEIKIPIEEIVALFADGAIELQTESGERIDATGARIDAGSLTVVVDSEERSVEVDDLVARRARVAWTGSIALGGNYTLGNTERRGGAASANVVRRTDDTRLTLDFNWSYQEDKDQVTDEWNLSQRRTYGAAKFDYFLSKKLYAYAQGTLENDAFKDLKLRGTIGAGLGYQLYEEDNFKLSVEGGLSYVDETRYDEEDKDYIAARGGYSLDWQPTEALSLLSDGQIFPSLEDKDDVYARVDTRLKLNMSENLFAQFQWIFDWNNAPPADTERIDHQFFIAAGWSF